MIDLHAHTALIEVMGLLGGFYDAMSKTLHITRYVPCKNVDHSNTHCDMCPGNCIIKTLFLQQILFAINISKYLFQCLRVKHQK